MKMVIRFSMPVILASMLIGLVLYAAETTSWALASSDNDPKLRLRLQSNHVASEVQANLMVNTLDDELNNDGDCSLREAIEAANTNTSIDECGSGDVLTDTITFDVAGIITVTSQLSVLVGGPLVVEGGDVITTSGGGTTRVWWVESGSEMTMNNLAVIDGYVPSTSDGAGIFNNGELTVSNSSFISNTAGVLYSWPGTSLGGAIHNAGILSVSGSTFSGNLATVKGGAIYSTGLLTITQSTIDNNTAGEFGSGIASDGNSMLTVLGDTFSENHSYYGGGLWATHDLTITNCTFKQNRASDGAGVYGGGDLSIHSSTFSGNLAFGDGGGVYGAGELTIHSSTFTSNNTEDGAGGGVYGSVKTEIFQSIFDGNSAERLEQCGWGGGIMSSGILTVTESTISNNLSCAGGGIYFIWGTLAIIRDSIFNGNQADIGGAILGTNLVIDGSTLVDNYAASVGGAISADNATISNSTLTGNVSGEFGGGVFHLEGEMRIINSTIAGNSTSGNGGGIFNNGSLSIAGTEISGNSADSFGGGIDNTSTAGITSTTIMSNTAGSGGGGIYSEEYLVLVNSAISGNHGVDGGGIYGTNSGGVVILNSTLYGNSASEDGGGIYSLCGLAVDDSTFYANSAAGSGGAFYHGQHDSGCSHSVTNSTISGNSASSGGGVYSSMGDFVLGNTIDANSPSGGDCNIAITDGGYNLDSDGTCGLDPANGSLPNTDPMLGPLQDNGGSTWTQALLGGSPAIDVVGDMLCLSTDQRGVPRPQDGNGDGIAICDIGAYEREFQPISPQSVSIFGQHEGFIDQEYAFTAMVEPVSTTLPITYNWQASDQQSITHTGGLTETVSFTWDEVGTKTITVTANNGYGLVTNTHSITLFDVFIRGLSAVNDSPTQLGETTVLSATVQQGTNVVYTWDFGDGGLGSGQVVTHTYQSAGTFTATVTATNSTNFENATTEVTVIIPVHSIFLPIAIKSGGSVQGMEYSTFGEGSLGMRLIERKRTLGIPVYQQ